MILFLDDFFLAAEKPSGIPSDTTPDPARRVLAHLVRDELARMGFPAGDLFLVHRLDLGTSGVVLFARDKVAATRAGGLFLRHEIQKTYVAHVGNPELLTQDDFLSDCYLAEEKTRPGQHVRRMRVVRSGGKRAITQFHVAERAPNYATLVAKPATGRTHQLRVQLASNGTPILGDELYAPKEIAAASARLQLHAASLEFVHPFTGEALRISSSVELPAPIARSRGRGL